MHALRPERKCLVSRTQSQSQRQRHTTQRRHQPQDTPSIATQSHVGEFHFHQRRAGGTFGREKLGDFGVERDGWTADLVDVASAHLVPLQAHESNFKRFVEHGRVVLLRNGPYANRIAVIVEIIDHNRALIDGPTTGVPRQSFPYRHLTLTPLKLTKLPRAAGSGVVKKQVEAEAIVEKWSKSSWAQKRAAIEKRRSLNDFERFSVMLAKKARADRVRKSIVANKA
ncbi:hypothetical protein NLI96_g904 [Meripilus lineatus]|uniref:60S ribosomal protein L14 n=1 Tax=Meripilus lineatus TaxID=2056292 RepID=A0AAD5VFR7_9APHY|nr:hypothetical protein NLI96_g904 [Physisporinus lineatus]